MTDSLSCGICGASTAGSHCLPIGPGVTSDCRPHAGHAGLFSCPACGATRTVIDEAWRTSVARIYAEYDTYAAAGGQEQGVGDPEGAGLRRRSGMLVDHLRAMHALPARGWLLDVGCGRGAFFSAFGPAFPGWQFAGTEVDQRHLPLLRRIPGFHELVAPAEPVSGRRYDLISLVHVLEHFERPVELLAQLARQADRHGLLLIQVPDWTRNPFALTITDHATHFTAASLERAARAAGWEPLGPATEWVPKELTLIARAAPQGAGPGLTSDPAAEARALRGALRWLEETRAEACRVAESSSWFGLFGTAIAATWLQPAVAQRLRGFVDEDPLRVGHLHLGQPILAPAEVPAGADIFVGLAPRVARPIAARWSATRPDVRFHLGPDLA